MHITKLLFKFKPTAETLIAFISAILMIPIYYIGTHNQNTVGLVVFVVIGNLLLNVTLPLYYITFIKKSSLSDLGITSRLIKTSICISIVLTLSSLPTLLQLAGNTTHQNLIRNIIFNLISLWEVFFVFGWLMLSFERALGPILAICITTICMLTYHIGSYPLGAMLGLGVAILIFGIIFMMTKNLFTLWPIAWGASSTIGTLQGKLDFSWTDICTYIVILILQIGFMFYCKFHQRKIASQ